MRYFGDIINGRMELSELGKFLENEWVNTPLIRNDMNISIDEYVIMPDHFHAIIIIGENQYNINNSVQRRNAMHGVSTTDNKLIFRNKFAPQIKNLSSVIRGVKSIVTTYAKKTNIEFKWQAGYYDRIVRTDNELHRIRKYMRENVSKWNG
jgi:putative transposase